MDTIIKIKVVLIDLSGTLHIDDSATPNALEALARLQAKENLTIKFVTNTTKESKKVLMSRLHKIGFEVKEKDVFTSLTAARQLIEQRSLRPFLMVDQKALEDFQGIPTDDSNAVVVGLAPEAFAYENMNKAMRLIQNGAQLIAIHKARYYKRGDGLALGPGPFVSALEYSTGIEAVVVGKPTQNFFLSSVSDVDCKPEQCVMIGDDVLDDVDGAQKAGMKGILVKTGKYRPGDETKIDPLPFLVVDTFAFAVDALEKML